MKKPDFASNRRKIALLLILTATACGTSQKPIQTTAGVPEGIDPISYAYGTDEEPCEDLDGKPLPDPDNSCDSKATVREIIKLNAKIRAAKSADQ